jgi:SPW repeat-containing protein
MKTAKSLSWLVALAGLWEVLAPFILGYSAPMVAMWNAIITGVVLIVLGVWTALNEELGPDKILDRVNVGVGVWLVVSPFVLGYAAVAAALWNDLIIGAVVIVLAAWAASVLDKEMTPQR